MAFLEGRATLPGSATPELSSQATSSEAHVDLSEWEVCHRQLILFSLATTVALGAEVAYTQAVPKIPQLYATLLRAAVWDCVIIGVLLAQVVDLSSVPILAGTDGAHYLPVAVLLYHGIKLVVCSAYDACSRGSSARCRNHRSLMSRRVLMELAGGTSGSKLLLGRVSFLASGGTLGLLVRRLLWVDDGPLVLVSFVVLMNAAYCAAGFAALEPRRTANSRRLVQWLCTSWGSRGAILTAPLKVCGVLLLAPFVLSIVTAQTFLKAVAFFVWCGVTWPCCRLHWENNVFDAFEREMAMPLLQCSYLAFACTLAVLVLSFGQLSGIHATIVASSTFYYIGMMLCWTTPAVLQERVGVEEAAATAAALGEDGQMQPLRGDRPSSCELGRSTPNCEREYELDDIKATCEEYQALLKQERHDRRVELAQLQDQVRDHELRARLREHAVQDAKHQLEKAEGAAKEVARQLNSELVIAREKCSELSYKLASALGGPCLPRPARPNLPILNLPLEVSQPEQGKDLGASKAVDVTVSQHPCSSSGSGRSSFTSEDGNDLGANSTAQPSSPEAKLGQQEEEDTALLANVSSESGDRNEQRPIDTSETLVASETLDPVGHVKASAQVTADAGGNGSSQDEVEVVCRSECDASREAVALAEEPSMQDLDDSDIFTGEEPNTDNGRVVRETSTDINSEDAITDQEQEGLTAYNE